MRVWWPKPRASWHGATATSHGHTGGVCNIQGACHSASQSMIADTRVGTSASMGASTSVDAMEAPLPGPWHEVADKTCGSVQEQSGVTCRCAQECLGSRHGCTHWQPSHSRFCSSSSRCSPRGKKKKEPSHALENCSRELPLHLPPASSPICSSGFSWKILVPDRSVS
ncbi:hypothetical protein SLEP1_g18996 [Rubroshorea leprosula]|nr:hypothetical protein SLEP1_g18996 [Rubroshorea leprosula]